jgi:cytochrome c oxidase cbb3-type subunit IV
MDMEWMRSAMTVIAFATFVGIVLWAWSSRRRGDFDAAARSILADDEAPRNPGGRHE